jgi:glycosyltransferase involved in cell wall biosynthesis
MGIHVRILAGQVGPGAGSHIYHQELVRRLAARGHQISVVCFSSTPEVRDSAEVFEIPLADYAGITFFWRTAALFQHRHLSRELKRLDMGPADVAIGGEHLFLRAYRWRFPQTPLIYVPHAPVAAKEINRYDLPPTMAWITSVLYGRMQRWALNDADRTLRFTHLGCDILKFYYGDSIRPRFVVNPVGFELPSLRRKERVGDEVRLLSVGRLVPWKRIDLALSALAAVRQYPWRFDVVGEGDTRKQLERKVRELGLENRVRFHGYQTDVGQWYEQADLFLFPSELEGFGFVMLEAMSYGIPCLAVRADFVNYWNANSEVITHGKDGLLTADENDYFRQLESVLRDPQQLIPLGMAARERVAEHFTWDKHLDRYEELFSEIIQERRRRLSQIRVPEILCVIKP